MKTTRNTSSGVSWKRRWQKGKRAFIAPSGIVLFIVILFGIIGGQKSFGQGVGISEGAIPDPHASSILELRSTLRGFLAPRMTTSERLFIASPAQGLLVYDTDKQAFFYYVNSSWKAIAGTGLGASNQLLGMDAAGSANEYKTLNGSSNITVTNGVGTISLNTIQDIQTSSTPSFAGLNLTNALTVPNGGTGLQSGIQGGIPYFNTNTSMASSALLAANGVVIGGGTGAAPATIGVGAANTVLRGTGGAPSFGQIMNGDITNATIDLTSKVTGILPLANGGTNSGTALNDNRVMVSSGGKIVEAGELTDGQVIVGKTGAAPQLVTLGNDATISNTGSLTLANTGVTAASYGSSTQVGTFTVDSKGRLTSAGNTTISGTLPGGLAGGDLSGTYPNPTVAKINGASLGTTTATNKNILVANGTSWNSVAMSGNVTIDDLGATTIGAGQVTNSMLAGNIDLTTKVTGVLPGANGGTGVNNGTNTITLGGNILTGGAFTTTPANALTLTTTGATNVTLPVTGTLATLDGNEALSNKTINGLTPLSLANGFSVSGGTVPATLTVPADATVTGSNSGDVTLAGQNYLSLAGQVITANPVDLSGSHAAGTLAAGRFPALTGDVTTVAGALGTTITNNAVTYAKMQNVSATNMLLGSSSTTTPVQEITIGSGLTLSGTTLTSSGLGGTVTSVSVLSANGLAGTVANASTTPEITLSTTVTGVLMGNGTSISAAVAGTDYVYPNTAIVGAQKTKITYDAKGLVTAGTDATATDIVNTAAGNITSVTVQGALNELDAEKIGLNTAIVAGTKTKISYDVNGLVTAGTDALAADILNTAAGNIASTTVQGALNELDVEKVIGNTAIVGAQKTKITYDAKGLVTSGTDATGADILNVAAGNIAATNVQDALNELDVEKVIGNTAIVGAQKTKITYDAKGLVTAGTDATATDIVNTAAGNITSVTVQGALNELDVEKVIGNTAIVGAQKTKITYDAKGLVTSGTDATGADILNVAAGNIAATNVQDALNELDVEKVIGNTAIVGAQKTKITYDAKGLVTAGTDATATDIVNTAAGNITSVTVQGALNELDAEKIGLNTAIVAGTKTKISYDVNGLVTAGTDALAADILNTAAGNIASTTVQGALNELDVEKVIGNTAIVGAQKTKITYDAKGLVTAGTDATATDIVNTAAGNITSVTVQGALNELDAEKIGLNTAIVAGTKTKISYDVNGLVTAGTDALAADILNTAAGNIASTTVQGALNELDVEKVIGNTAIVGAQKTKITYDAKGLVTSGTDATGADILNVAAGNIAATNVQDALNELDVEKVIGNTAIVGAQKTKITYDAKGLVTAGTDATATDIVNTAAGNITSVTVQGALNELDAEKIGLNTAIVAGTKTKISYDVNGLVTAGTDALAADILNTAAGNIASTTVQGALNELDVEKVIGNTAIVGAQKTKITYDAKGLVTSGTDATGADILNVAAGNIAATNVQDALNELDVEKVIGNTAIVGAQKTKITYDAKGLVTAGTDATATDIVNTAAGNITSVTVQGALNELDVEKVIGNTAIVGAQKTKITYDAKGLVTSGTDATGADILNVAAGNIAATNVQDALNELDVEKVIGNTAIVGAQKTKITYDAKGLVTAGTDATATDIVNTAAGNITSVTVQGALNELDAEKIGLNTAIVAGTKTKISYDVNGLVTAGTDALAADILNTAAGNIASTTVQGALNELDVEKVIGNTAIVGAQKTKITYDAKGLVTAGTDATATDIVNTAAGNITSVTVQGALNELDAEKIGLNTAIVAGTKTKISYDVNGLVTAGTDALAADILNTAAGNIASTTVQGALNELDVEKVIGNTAIVGAQKTKITYDAKGLVTSGTDATGADILNVAAGNIAATNVQDALNELDVEKVIGNTAIVGAQKTKITYDAKGLVTAGTDATATDIVNTAAGNITSVTVQGALNELDAEKIGLNTAIVAGTKTKISYDVNGLVTAGTDALAADILNTAAGNIASTTVQGALNELDVEKVIGNTAIVGAQKTKITYDAKGLVTSGTDATGADILNVAAGNIAATNVQDALNELDVEKVIGNTAIVGAQKTKITYDAKGLVTAGTDATATDIVNTAAGNITSVTVQGALNELDAEKIGLNTAIVAGTKTKISYDVNGLVTAGTDALAADILNTAAGNIASTTVQGALNELDVEKVIGNTAIVGAQKTKITYDAKGLVTSGTDATGADILNVAAGNIAATNVQDALNELDVEKVIGNTAIVGAQKTKITYDAKGLVTSGTDATGADILNVAAGNIAATNVQDALNELDVEKVIGNTAIVGAQKTKITYDAKGLVTAGTDATATDIVNTAAGNITSVTVQGALNELDAEKIGLNTAIVAGTKTKISYDVNGLVTAGTDALAADILNTAAGNIASTTVQGALNELDVEKVIGNTAIVGAQKTKITYDAKGLVTSGTDATGADILNVAAGNIAATNVQDALNELDVEKVIGNTAIVGAQKTKITYDAKGLVTAGTDATATDIVNTAAGNITSVTVQGALNELDAEKIGLNTAIVAGTKTKISYDVNGLVTAGTDALAADILNTAAGNIASTTVQGALNELDVEKVIGNTAIVGAQKTKITYDAKGLVTSGTDATGADILNVAAGNIAATNVQDALNELDVEKVIGNTAIVGAQKTKITYDAKGLVTAGTDATATDIVNTAAGNITSVTVQGALNELDAEKIGLNTAIVAGTKTKISYDVNGLVTAGTDALAADILNTAAGNIASTTVQGALNELDVEKVIGNTAIVGAQKTKITYDAKGLVTSGTDATGADILNVAAGNIAATNVQDALNELDVEKVIGNTAIVGAQKTKITYDAKGLVTSGTDATGADILNVAAGNIAATNVQDALNELDVEKVIGNTAIVGAQKTKITYDAKGLVTSGTDATGADILNVAAGNIAATNVQDALNELDVEKVIGNTAIVGAQKTKITYDAKGLVTAGTDATATDIVNTAAGNITSVTVQGALNELDAEKIGLNTAIVAGTKTKISYDVNGLVTAGTDALAADILNTAAGNIASTTVQGALNELDVEKVIGNTAIVGAQKTKITYDAKGLVTSGTDATGADILNVAAGNIAATNVQDALNELDVEKVIGNTAIVGAQKTKITYDAKGLVTAGTDATATDIVNTAAGNITSVTVQGALNELDAEKIGLNTAIVAGTKTKISYDVNGLVTAGTDALAADILNTAAGNIASTTVQGALNELDVEKVIGNTAIVGAQKTKITYDAKGLVTSGTDATGADILNVAAGNIAATNVQDALNELDVEKVIGNTAIVGAQKTKITYDAKGLVTAGTDATATDIVNTAAGNITSVTVQGALNELDAEKIGLNTAIVAGTKTKISYDVNGLVTAGTDALAADILNTAAGNIASTTVQGALNELDAEKIGLNTAIVAGTKTKISYDVNGLVTAGTDALAADILNTAAGNIASTTVQGALNELDVEKVIGNTAIVGAQKTKITYDAKGLVTSGTDATGADILNVAAGNIAATNVQDALNELDVEKVIGNTAIVGAQKTKITYDAKGLVTAGTDATATDIVNTAAGNITSVTVQGALNELDAEKIGLNTAIVAGTKTKISYDVNGLVTAGTDALAADILNTAAGNIASTTVQGALNELDVEKVIGNTAIVGAQKTKITYDAKGLVTSGTDATGADILNVAAGNIAATNVQDALNELDVEKVIGNTAIVGAQKTKITYDAKGLVTAGTDATATDIVNTAAGNITSVTVQGALNELDAEKIGLNTAIVAGTKTKISYDVNGLVTAGTDALAADILNTAAGNIASTTVQGALNELDVEKVIGNTAIVGAQKTKITYDAKGLVTSGTDATTSDIAPSTNRNYVTDAQQIVLGNTSGTNTGDNAANSSTTYIGTTAIALNRASSAQSLTGITSIDGTATNLSGTPALPNGTTATTQTAGNNSTRLATTAYVDNGLSGKISTYGSQTANFVLASPNGSSGAPSFRAILAADIPTLNQNTTGTANNVTGTVAVGNGGTGATTLTGYVKGSGTSAMTASATIPGTDISGNISGNAATATSATTASNLAGGAAGSIPYQTASGTTTLLAAGTTNYVLKMNAGGTPEWGTTGVGDMLLGTAQTVTALKTHTAGITANGGAINLNVASNNATNINSGTSAGTVTIGGTAAQQIDIGANSGDKIINVGTGTGKNTITIGDNTNTQTRVNIYAGSDPTNGEVHVYGDLNMDAAGSTVAAPREIGISNMLTGNAIRYTMGDAWSGFQAKYGGRMQFMAYNGIEIVGSRGTDVTLPFKDSGTDPSLDVIGTEIGDVVLAATAASGQTANIQEWRNSSGAALASVSSTGKISTSGGAAIYGALNYGVDAGASDAYSISLSPAPTSYVAGMVIAFDANTANLGNCTISVNGLAAQNIRKRVNTTLVDNDILAGMVCLLIYDGTNFKIMNPIVP